MGSSTLDMHLLKVMALPMRRHVGRTGGAKGASREYVGSMAKARAEKSTTHSLGSRGTKGRSRDQDAVAGLMRYQGESQKSPRRTHRAHKAPRQIDTVRPPHAARRLLSCLAENRNAVNLAVSKRFTALYYWPLRLPKCMKGGNTKLGEIWAPPDHHQKHLGLSHAV